MHRPSCQTAPIYMHEHMHNMHTHMHTYLDVADVWMVGRLLQLSKLHIWRQLQIVSKCWNSIIVFPSNENGWSSKFQYDIIRPTITLTSIYLQLAFIVIGRAAEILHEIQGKSPWRSMDRRKISPANLLKVRRSGEISSVSSVSVWLDEKFTNYTGANKFRPWVQKAQEVQSRNCFILQE